MTTTGTTAPPEEPNGDTSSPDLERPTRHPYRGVCSALARTTGTDVLLWRVLFVVLAFFDGLGILLYLVGLLTIPRVGEVHSVAERLFRGPNRRLRRDEILLIVLTLVAAGHMLGHGNNLVALVVIAGFVLLFLHGRQDAPPAEPVGTPPLVQPTVARPASHVADVTFAPPPPRAKSALGSLTLGLATLVVGFLVLLNTAASADIEAEVIVAAALAVVGAGLIVGAWWGRSALLVVMAVLLGIALAATTAVRPMLEAGVGERTWTPTGAADYRLGVGDATLDLRNMIIGDGAPPQLEARVDIGELTIIVPKAVRVAVRMHADLGELAVPDPVNGLLFNGRRDRIDLDVNEGLSFGFDKINGRDVEREITIGPEGPTLIRVDASVRIGQVTVIRRG